MAIPYQSFADSKPFKFLVGETGKPFYIHASLAAQQSTTLATLVEGGMVEAKREYAILDDVDEETFIRFTQFAYTGDYTVAEPHVVLTEVGIENGIENGEPSRSKDPVIEIPDAMGVPADEPIPEEAFAAEPVLEEPFADEAIPEEAVAAEPAEPVYPGYGWGSFGSTTRKKKFKKAKISPWVDDRADEYVEPTQKSIQVARPEIKSKGDRLWDAFKAKAYVKWADAWEPSVNADDCEDYTPVFLCHAKLYRFSDKYSIEPLLELVLQKLRLNLSRFKLHSQRVGDVVELLKYAYEHTTDYEEGIDRLRNLIADYVVCHIEKIVGFGDFTKLLQENGDVVKDLMPKLMQRLD